MFLETGRSRRPRDQGGRGNRGTGPGARLRVRANLERRGFRFIREDAVRQGHTRRSGTAARRTRSVLGSRHRVGRAP